MRQSRNVVDLRKVTRAKRTPPANNARIQFPASDRTSPLRKKRRRTRIITLCTLIFFLPPLLLWCVSFVSYLPQYNIQTVTVNGTQTISDSDVQDFIETQIATSTHPFLSPKNIFLYHSEAIVQAILHFFPTIKSVQVDRASLLATVIEVKVQERQPFAQWCDDVENCYLMDDSGFIFASAVEVRPPQNVGLTSTTTHTTASYTFHGGIATSTSPIGQSFIPKHTTDIITLLDKLAQARFVPLGATVVDEHDFSVPLKDSFFIKASFGEGASTLINNLQLILGTSVLKGREADIEYIDLRFGDRAYYKLKGKLPSHAP